MHINNRQYFAEWIGNPDVEGFCKHAIEMHGVRATPAEMATAKLAASTACPPPFAQAVKCSDDELFCIEWQGVDGDDSEIEFTLIGYPLPADNGSGPD